MQIKKSITPAHLVCLKDGKSMRTLMRRVMTTYRMTPNQYRAKWGLAKDCPMVAPTYADKRSALAKSFGLGRGKKAT